MSESSIEVTKISFDFTDSQVTTCTVEFVGHGDVPFQLDRGVKTKSFPARMSAVDIIQGEITKMEYLYW